MKVDSAATRIAANAAAQALGAVPTPENTHMTYESDRARRQSRKAADGARKQTMREQRERDARKGSKT